MANCVYKSDMLLVLQEKVGCGAKYNTFSIVANFLSHITVKNYEN